MVLDKSFFLYLWAIFGVNIMWKIWTNKGDLVWVWSSEVSSVVQADRRSGRQKRMLLFLFGWPLTSAAVTFFWLADQSCWNAADKNPNCKRREALRYLNRAWLCQAPPETKRESEEWETQMFCFLFSQSTVTNTAQEEGFSDHVCLLSSQLLFLSVFIILNPPYKQRFITLCMRWRECIERTLSQSHQRQLLVTNLWHLSS